MPAGSSTSLMSQGNQESRMLMKRILVKCADISNASRPLKLCCEWASRVSEEYFSQTEEEQQRGLPVIFRDFERETCKLPVTQVCRRVCMRKRGVASCGRGSGHMKGVALCEKNVSLLKTAYVYGYVQ